MKTMTASSFLTKVLLPGLCATSCFGGKQVKPDGKVWQSSVVHSEGKGILFATPDQVARIDGKSAASDITIAVGARVTSKIDGLVGNYCEGGKIAVISDDRRTISVSVETDASRVASCIQARALRLAHGMEDGFVPTNDEAEYRGTNLDYIPFVPAEED